MSRHVQQPLRSGRAGPARQRLPAGQRPRLLMVAASLAALLIVALAGWLDATGRWPFEADPGPPPAVVTAPPGLGRPVRYLGPATALAVLGTLPVKGRAPSTGYRRSAFGAPWLDADLNGCDTRNDILRRDLSDQKARAGDPCQVGSGRLADPYTDRELEFTRGAGTSGAVQIDHVVALGNAWQTGAGRLSELQRQSLANDPLNLLAVDGPANVEKSDADAATWLPPNKAFRCRYVARQISVKAAYTLWVTPPEKAAMERILRACPGEPALASGYGR